MESPHRKDEILAALETQEAQSLAYWNAFPTGIFFARIGESWSPAETVRHLSKSTRAVVKALRIPRLLLRLMFGKARRRPITFDELVTRYRRLLAEGGGAGRFAPSPRSEADLQTWRASIMRSYVQSMRELREAMVRWPEDSLDALQLPHPLLGKIIVREMLFFTLYHHGHHVAVVKRHLAERPAS